MFLPSKKLILPCHKNGYLQSASDARKWRDRFKRNPLAKVADMFIPRPLRAWRWWPCCCGEPTPTTVCPFFESTLPTTYRVELANASGATGVYYLDYYDHEENFSRCRWRIDTGLTVCACDYANVYKSISLTYGWGIGSPGVVLSEGNFIGAAMFVWTGVSGQTTGYLDPQSFTPSGCDTTCMSTFASSTCHISPYTE